MHHSIQKENSDWYTFKMYPVWFLLNAFSSANKKISKFDILD